MKEVIEVLNKVHDFLGILIRENLIKEAPYLDEEPMLKVSDLADDLWEVIHKGLPCNNAAKMRTALLIVKRLFDGRIMFQPAIREAHKAVDAALAAPARNCDRPLIVDGPADNAVNKAWLAFKRCNPDVYFDVSGLLRCIAWLLDEAKGEAK